MKYKFAPEENKKCARVIDLTVTLEEAKANCTNNNRCIAITNTNEACVGLFEICEKIEIKDGSNRCIYTKTKGMILNERQCIYALIVFINRWQI